MESLLKSGDVAKRLGINIATVERMARAGRLPAIKVGKLWEISRGRSGPLAGGACKLRTPSVPQMNGRRGKCICGSGTSTGASRKRDASVAEDVWEFRYYETATEGQRRRRSMIVGSVSRYPTQADALRASRAVRLRLNVESRWVDPSRSVLWSTDTWSRNCRNDIRPSDRI